VKKSARLQRPEEVEKLRESILKKREGQRLRVAVCAGTACLAAGAADVLSSLKEVMGDCNLDGEIDLIGSGCRGFCEKGPLLVIYPKGTCYVRVSPKDAREIVEKTIIEGKVIDRLLYRDPVAQKEFRTEREIPFYQKQHRIVLDQSGRIDPKRIEDYIAAGGYSALAKVLSGISRESVVEEIVRSGLRGRGGAGFPTGLKWKACIASPGEKKFLICNCDEGDPGAYMDRSILEGNPYRVLEGMTIGAYAIGAREGFVYVRNEYPLAVENIGLAVKTAREMGLLGKNILGSDFSFDVEVVGGGGAFVCGEETALMASIEGRPGEPRPRPPYPAEKGLWGYPTNINNVETWANVPSIILNGAEWFSSVGTEGSKGTKVFSLVGKIRNTGLVEVPMGISLREIIFDIGGGIPDDRPFKAVQTGGPSGGCIPERYLDLPVDYERLTEVGSMMGSGGMIVMDEGTCMVDVARFFTSFLIEESCGKCTPCREGLRQAGRILEKIVRGEGREEDLALLEELAEGIAQASLCGLGKTAPNPILTTLRYFRDEYLAHIKERRCPAKVCKALITYSIDPEKCTGCGACARACPVKCISGERKKPHIIDQSRCTKCGICKSTCKFDAVRVN